MRLLRRLLRLPWTIILLGFWIACGATAGIFALGLIVYLAPLP